MQHQIIKTVSGAINYPEKSARVLLFFCPKNKGQEVFLSQFAKNNQQICTANKPHSYASSISGANSEVCGKMVSSEYRIASGSILRVLIKLNRGYGKMPLSASMYLRVRKGAAYRLVEIPTFQSLSAVFTKASIEGAFDVITFDEASAEGVKTIESYRQMYSSVNVDRVVSTNRVIIEQTSMPEKKEVVKLEDADTGKETTVVRSRRRRAIDV